MAARPGSFASNTLQYKSAFEKNEVKIYGPDATVDCIVPEDIGRFCGRVLAEGPQDEQRAIYLYGPKLLSQMDAVKTLAKVLGKNPKIEIANEQDAYKLFVEERGVPVPIANYMIRQSGKTAGEQISGIRLSDYRRAAVPMFKKYSGRKGTTFEEWAEQNKRKFVS